MSDADEIHKLVEKINEGTRQTGRDTTVTESKEGDS